MADIQVDDKVLPVEAGLGEVEIAEPEFCQGAEEAVALGSP
jgi:hypothetical protein